MEILILHPGALGDVILSLPAISLLRNKYPFARITVAGNVDHLVPAVSGYADRTLSLATLPLHSLFSQNELPEAEAGFWKSFDRIVSWTGAGDPAFVKRFKEIHSNVRIASWRPAASGEKRHVSQLFVDSLDLGATAPIEPVPVLLNSDLRAEGEAWLLARGWNGLDPLMALHPGAGSRTKWWPTSRFAELARRLLLDGEGKLLIIEGSAELGLSRQIMPALPADRVMLFDGMNLGCLASVLAQCNLFIGNDSGVAHLAAAIGIRSIVLFGPTLPQHWAPLGRDVTALRKAQGCGGCSSTGNRHICLENLTVDDVIRAAKR